MACPNQIPAPARHGTTLVDASTGSVRSGLSGIRVDALAGSGVAVLDSVAGNVVVVSGGSSDGAGTHGRAQPRIYLI